jgi:hypothetical protein
MKPMMRIHDISTGEIIDREMTDEEYAAHISEQVPTSGAVQVNTEADQAKAAAKAALLERLGITADEAALLLG